MKMPRFRVRTLMAIVVLAGLLTWAAMMGVRTFDRARRAWSHGEQGRIWGQMAARGGSLAEFEARCARYYERLARKYQQAAWRPWVPVAPDPPAPGHPGAEE